MIFRIPVDNELGKRLNEATVARHDDKIRAHSDYPHRARRLFETRPAHISIPRYALFRMLHQEFSGAGLPGLPLLLGTGRKIVKALPWIRRGLRA